MLDKNLTGEQIQKIMDVFLYSALQPIVLYSDVFDEQVSLLLTVATTNKKRKLSVLDRSELIANLCKILVITDRVEKFELIKQSKLERSFLHCFIRAVLLECSGFVTKYRNFVYKPDKATRNNLDNMSYINLGCSRTQLYEITQNSTDYLNKFYAFRGKVLDNYLRHSSVQAKARISMSGNSNLDFMDLKQSILKAMVIALDKYDSSKGALTTYINWWVLNAQTCSAEHEYGIAYTVPQSQKKKMFDGTSTDVNFSVSLDALLTSDDDDISNLHNFLSDDNTVSKTVESYQEINAVRLLVKSIDPYGIARLSLDIGEAFTEKEREKMRRQTLKETVNT